MKKITRRDFLKQGFLISATSLTLPLLEPLSRLIHKVQAQSQGLIFPHPALYYQVLKRNSVQCLLCPRYCTVSEGGRGFCEVRENRKGKLYTLSYANPCAVHVDPIEKKPFYHVLPSTNVFSLSTAGCNFTCLNCQNWEISQARPEETVNFELPPQKVVEFTLKEKSPSIACTYAEPVVFYEYMFDIFKLAREKNIITLFHTNGFINPEPLRQLCQFTSAANIDLKGFTEEFYTKVTSGQLLPVLETLQILRENRVHTEVTNLVIPGYNDDFEKIKEMCLWLKEKLGAEIPLHFSRFYPAYKLLNLSPTPLKTLEKAQEIAISTGLHYVYIGNIPGHKGENTFCPKCKKIIIKRVGYSVLENNVKKGKCSYCGYKIAGVW
ncbi:MAG: AmmeMemoRadiSam system radical SAM enzyme [Candidatus Edwardsbacteria bacterium]